MYSIEVKKSALKELLLIPKEQREKIIDAIDDLALEPRPAGVKKLKADEGYRIRIGDYRVIYTIEDAVRIIQVVRVRHRKDVYRH